MALAPIALTAPQYENYGNWWIKFYAQGTTTPIVMATDSDGITLLARAEISVGGTVPLGFIKTPGDAMFIPWVDGDYDLWLFPTAAEADANDTTNAIQLADDINADPNSPDSILPIVYASESLPIVFNTVADAKAGIAADGSTVSLAIGQRIVTNENSTGNGGGANYLVAANQAVDGYGDHLLDNGNVALLQSDGAVNVLQFGAVGDGATDDTVAIQAVLDSGATKIIFDGTFAYSSTITISNTVDIEVIGGFKYIGTYYNADPHFDITADDVHILGGDWNANYDIGTILRFGVGTTGGSIKYATFRNLLSKTALGAASGDFACITLKGSFAVVSNCKIFDCENTDPGTTNDSFPRGVAITGDSNIVDNLSMSDVRCPVITIGNKNRLSNIKAYNVKDNGVYYGGSYNIIRGLYIKDAVDEPVVFFGDNNTIIDVVLDNRQSGSVAGSFGVEDADNCLIDGLTIIGTLKCSNLLKARTGNTQSSIKIIGLNAIISSVYYTFSFIEGNTDFTLVDSMVTVVKDSGYDSSAVFDGGNTVLNNCKFVIEEASSFTTSNTYLYFNDIDASNSRNVSIQSRLSYGKYVRNVPFADNTGSKNLWNNAWTTSFIDPAYAESRKEYFGSAAPIVGAWIAGDVVWNTTPSAGGTMGWVCTTAGTPGTWKTFGAISA